MSDSPWNAKRNRRASPRGIQPQGAQVPHVPHQAPVDVKPKARMRSMPKPQADPQAAKPENLAQALQNTMPAQKIKPFSFLFVMAIAILIVAVLVAALVSGAYKTRYEGLVQEREAQARELQAEKDDYLNARGNSGHLPLIEKYAQEFGVNASFVSAIIMRESSYRPGTVRSRVGAMGLMQIMPHTGTFIAGKLNVNGYTQETLDDPETNIRFGTYYLSYLSNMFQGDPVMVAAAYHAGDSNAQLWALRHGENQKTIRVDQIPTPDTRDYVGKVMRAYAIYFEKDQGSPAGTGLDLPKLSQP